jgi:hypothetical protein
MIAIAVASGNRVLIGRTLVTIREGRRYGWVAVLRFAGSCVGSGGRDGVVMR